MQLLWVDKNFQNKDKINNYQLDSSRTTDSVSNINKREELLKRKDKETNEISPKKIKENNEEMINLVKNLKGNKNEFNLNMVTFKKRLSIFLCVIYLILFLISIPKIGIKLGKEQNIDLLIKNNTNTQINILINKLPFHCEENINLNNETNDKNNNCETTGYILDFINNRAFIFRWIIGFIYFVLKCIFFIYTNNKNDDNNIQLEKKISLYQKVSILIFPLILFYLDIRNNISYIEINLKHAYNKTVSFYIMKQKSFSFNDYVEGLIPTFFTFLISIDYDNLQQIIYNYILLKEKQKKII